MEQSPEISKEDIKIIKLSHELTEVLKKHEELVREFNRIIDADDPEREIVGRELDKFCEEHKEQLDEIIGLQNKGDLHSDTGELMRYSTQRSFMKGFDKQN